MIVLTPLLILTAGNASLVFDCVYNTTIKSRTLKDSDFKVFLVGESLFRFYSLSLHRHRSNSLVPSPTESRLRYNRTRPQSLSANLLANDYFLSYPDRSEPCLANGFLVDRIVVLQRSSWR